MKTLETQFKRSGFDYAQIFRKGDIAVYCQYQGEKYWFETVIIQKNAERIIAGKTIPASESIPGNEAWGQKGWTFHDLRSALGKATELQEIRDRRILAEREGNKTIL